MAQITLSEKAAERLRDAARQRGADITEILEQAVERYLAATWIPGRQPATPELTEQQIVIEQEQRIYAACQQELLAMYPGEYVAMRAGQVIDHDTDRIALSRRIRTRYGNQPIFMTPVRSETVQTIYLRSPRLLDEPM